VRPVGCSLFEDRSDFWTHVPGGNLIESRTAEWRYDLGLESLDLASVAALALEHMDVLTLPFETPSVKVRRGFLLHSVDLGSEVALLAVGNFGGKSYPQVLKLLFHPLRADHQTAFTSLVTDLAVEKLWFMDAALRTWFHGVEAFAGLAPMCRTLQLANVLASETIWIVPHVLRTQPSTSESSEPGSTDYVVLVLKVAIALAVLVATVALLR
jgi:hypothetical protein